MAQARIVFERAQILARGGGNGMRLQLEPRKAVLGANAVDRQGMIVVARERAPGNEVEEPPLQPRGEVWQSDDPAAPPGNLGDQGDDLAQRVNLRAPEFIGLTAGGAAVQAAQHRIDHVIDEYRLEATLG